MFGALLATMFVNLLGFVGEKLEVPILSELIPLPGDLSVHFVRLLTWILSDRSIGDPPILSLGWLPLLFNLVFYFVIAAIVLSALKVFRGRTPVR